MRSAALKTNEIRRYGNYRTRLLAAGLLEVQPDQGTAMTSRAAQYLWS